MGRRNHDVLAAMNFEINGTGTAEYVAGTVDDDENAYAGTASDLRNGQGWNRRVYSCTADNGEDV